MSGYSHSLWRSMEGKEKVSKASVNYRRADGPRRCGNCNMFYPVSPLIGSCELVRGVIDVQDRCGEWARIGSARKSRTEGYDEQNKPKSPGG